MGNGEHSKDPGASKRLAACRSGLAGAESGVCKLLHILIILDMYGAPDLAHADDE